MFHSFECCSWRALRVQKILSNKGDESPKSSHSCSKNNWLDDLCSFDVGEEDDDIDLEELGRELSEAASLNPTGKEQNNVTKSRKESLPSGQSTRPIDGRIPGEVHKFVKTSQIKNFDYQYYVLLDVILLESEV